MINIDFVKAKTLHLSWLTRISDFLEGKSSLTLSEVVSHKHCELGQWIYSEGMKKYSHLPQMQALEEVHQRLHKAISNIVELYSKEALDEAHFEYEKMLTYSERILSLLDDMKQIHHQH